ncbi:Legumain [Plecturocebus cupreus]
MVLYIEAYESGSTMNHLPDGINACYYDEKRSTYLGDWYSVHWMEDSDVEYLMKETLDKQYHLVKSHTNTSHIMQYGNKTISTMKVMQLQCMKHKAASPDSLPPITCLDLTPSPDVPLMIRRRKLMNTMIWRSPDSSQRRPSGAEAEQLLTKRALLTGHSCYPEALLHFRAHCFSWHCPMIKLYRDHVCLHHS